jgi:hypothetical protein
VLFLIFYDFFTTILKSITPEVKGNEVNGKSGKEILDKWESGGSDFKAQREA